MTRAGVSDRRGHSSPLFELFFLKIFGDNMEHLEWVRDYMTDEKERYPLETSEGLRACWSAAGGVMGPCIHCGLRKVNQCYVKKGLGLPSDTHGNVLFQRHSDNKVDYIYVPHAVSNKEGSLTLFDWKDPYFHEIIGEAMGCGDRRELGCDHGFRLCAHCMSFHSNCGAEKVGDLSDRHDNMGKRFAMESRPITRAGELIL